MNKHITFSMKSSENKTELFSIYSDLDKEIITEASKNNLYLIGGTAIEIWLNHLGIKGWRKRSDNDLDFLIDEATSNQLNKFKDFLKDKGFKRKSNLSYKFNKIDIDFIYYEDSRYDFDITLLKPSMFNLIKSIKLMSPIFLFSSKYLRVQAINSVKVKINTQYDRYKMDLKDLIDLLKIIKKLKLEKDLEEALEYFYGDYKDSNRIKLVEEFISKELKL